MDIKDIQELIKFVAKSGATEVDLEIDNFKISIKSPPMKAGKLIDQKIIVSPDQQIVAPINQSQNHTSIQEVETNTNTDEKSEPLNDEKYITIKSPMIGTFYRKPSPDKEVFVNVGDSISQGDVLCVIEAMKLFNEIESEYSGKIIKVLVDDSSPIEFDQPLFLIDPS
ncbi:MAG: acetyl-CoA carboxylase, biotin carboxyl carrier protein [Flavobacteriales bacterium]|nr:acetyl-CoA carboxylase, biotin carboxyl carrier protein [Flavobacteriales bacterium]|tara:strand:- start:361 stop:864 length:504 start_codon:yes stop_codon:yes gene_type:complete